MKEAFSVKLQTENLSLFFFFFFLLKIEIKQNPGCPNKEYNSIFEHINHITRAYPRSKKKKSALIDDYENIIAYWKNPSKGEQM